MNHKWFKSKIEIFKNRKTKSIHEICEYRKIVLSLQAKWQQMTINYEQDYLQELYEEGNCKNKKYRFQPQVIKKYQKRIDTLMAATRIEDLFVFNSLNFESLDNGYYSIRIDYHYRLEFKLREEGTEKILTICIITDITNHYQ